MCAFYLTVEDLDALAVGAALLGSGGGGDPKPELLRTKELMMKFGPVEMISLEALEDNALIVPLAFIGAPLVSIEKLPSGKECDHILRMIEGHFKQKVSALVAAEIGGSNAFAPLAFSARSKIPVVDADTIGRAFPELQMSACSLAGIKADPTFIADSMGNTAVVSANSHKKLEQMCRALTVSLGSIIAAGLYVCRGREAKQALVPNTQSLALSLGKKVLEAGGDAANVLCQNFQARHIGSGTISDIQLDVQDGFLRGKVQIAEFVIHFQNEYLFVEKNGQACAATPDIIAILDRERGYPLTVENLKFGLGVDIITLPAPSVWNTEKGLRLVGPQAFGYRGVA